MKTRYRFRLSLFVVPAMVSMFGVCPVVAPVMAAEPGMQETATEKVSAVVTGIDRQARTVTLRGDNGEIRTVEVPPDVEYFSKLKLGDRINAAYTESLLLQLQPSGTPDDTSSAEVSRGEEDGKPTVTGATRRVISAKVVAVDTQKNTITLQGPKGNEMQFDVHNPDRQAVLKKVKVGDLVRATYNRSVAISLSPAPSDTGK
ncbi:hypothetical protein V5738_08790 [Salinisphaera sp. SPP-AMP-43]|uniref:hypothetical protein n=1 Tax=Salinisphaera sp. SPP-AMP-43 TaxID=3121288 RepID=UPI003C6DDF55